MLIMSRHGLYSPTERVEIFKIGPEHGETPVRPYTLTSGGSGDISRELFRNSSSKKSVNDQVCDAQ
jgi:hypothetical protein